MFTREHLIVGAVGFVLGGAVATASITVVLSLTKPEPATTPPVAPAPVTAPPAAAAVAEAAPAAAQPATPPAAVQAAAPVKAAPVPAAPPALVKEESDRQAEDARQLAQRKKSLESQLSDSEEIIRLKEQQIRDMEARLKAGQ